MSANYLEIVKQVAQDLESIIEKTDSLVTGRGIGMKVMIYSEDWKMLWSSLTNSPNS